MSDSRTAAPPRARRTRRETRPIRGPLALSAVLMAAFVVYTVLVVEWSPFIRLDFFLNRNFHVHWLWPTLHIADRIGQRAVCLPILGSAIAVTAWRHRSWRPALLGVAGIFVVNLLVLIAKLALSRGHPLQGESFFSDGDMYPSGHTANILVVYGLCFHLVTHYGHVSARVRKLLAGAVVLLSAVMLATSLLLRWHWFSDLVGGFIVGGAVLALTIGIDAAVPFRSPKMVVIPPRPVAPVEVTARPSSDETPAAVPGRVSLRRRLPDSSAGVAGRRSRR